jgi:hypothetical protein
MESTMKIKVPNFYILLEILTYYMKNSLKVYLTLKMLSKRANKFISENNEYLLN